jgi:hypothetical protein
MRRYFHFLLLVELLIIANPVHAETEKVELSEGYKFAVGVGAAIVKFDTKIKVLDKQDGNSVFLDPEGNLDLPEISHVNTLYGRYNFNQVHSIGFSLFGVRRESRPIDFDKTFDEVRVIGDAVITDKTNFYSVDYGYSLFIDDRSKIKLLAGIYSIDLNYVFQAEGEIIIDGVSDSDMITEDANIFAPLPLIGLDFWFMFTPEWSMATKIAFVAGSYDDLSAVVMQTGINAQYKINKNVGVVIGLASFAADIVIEDNTEKQNISYAYDGLFAGMHFVF